jgi:hypothetical protein
MRARECHKGHGGCEKSARPAGNTGHELGNNLKLAVKPATNLSRPNAVSAKPWPFFAARVRHVTSLKALAPGQSYPLLKVKLKL